MLLVNCCCLCCCCSYSDNSMVPGLNLAETQDLRCIDNINCTMCVCKARLTNQWQPTHRIILFILCQCFRRAAAINIWVMFNIEREGRVPLCPVRAQCQKAGVSLAQSPWSVINNYCVVYTGLQDFCSSMSEWSTQAKGSCLASQWSSLSLGQSWVLTAWKPVHTYSCFAMHHPDWSID